MMEANRLLEELEEMAEKLAVEVRYDDLMEGDFKVKGGSCKLRGRNMIIMDRRTPLRERIDLLTRALSQFDLRGIFTRPYVRRMIRDGSVGRDKKSPKSEKGDED